MERGGKLKIMMRIAHHYNCCHLYAKQRQTKKKTKCSNIGDIPKYKAYEKASIDNVAHNEPDRYESPTQERRLPCMIDKTVDT